MVLDARRLGCGARARQNHRRPSLGRHRDLQLGTPQLRGHVHSRAELIQIPRRETIPFDVDVRQDGRQWVIVGRSYRLAIHLEIELRSRRNGSLQLPEPFETQGVSGLADTTQAEYGGRYE